MSPIIIAEPHIAFSSPKKLGPDYSDHEPLLPNTPDNGLCTVYTLGYAGGMGNLKTHRGKEVMSYLRAMLTRPGVSSRLVTFHVSRLRRSALLGSFLARVFATGSKVLLEPNAVSMVVFPVLQYFTRAESAQHQLFDCRPSPRSHTLSDIQASCP